jgi:hypothetical protein
MPHRTHPHRPVAAQPDSAARGEWPQWCRGRKRCRWRPLHPLHPCVRCTRCARCTRCTRCGRRARPCRRSTGPRPNDPDPGCPADAALDCDGQPVASARRAGAPGGADGHSAGTVPAGRRCRGGGAALRRPPSPFGTGDRLCSARSTRSRRARRRIDPSTHAPRRVRGRIRRRAWVTDAVATGERVQPAA